MPSTAVAGLTTAQLQRFWRSMRGFRRGCRMSSPSRPERISARLLGAQIGLRNERLWRSKIPRATIVDGIVKLAENQAGYAHPGLRPTPS